jgi:hypothetical protein
LAGEISQFAVFNTIIRSFQGLARHLNSDGHGPELKRARKGRIQMSSQSPITRTLVAIAAALAMSTVAVGAAVGPAQAVASPAKVSLNA